jgi:beta-galactosidase
MDAGRLLFYADGAAEAIVSLDVGENIRVSAGSPPKVLSHGGVRLEAAILPRDEAVERWPGHPWKRRRTGVSLPVVNLARAAMAIFEPPWVGTGDSTGVDIAMEARGFYRGFALYEPAADAGRTLLLQGVADVITAYDGDRRLDTRISGGQWQLYRGETGRWRFKTESWGHSNFDDSRLPSLRLCSRKGIAAMFQVVREQPLAGQWRFRLMDQWLPERLACEDHPFDPVLDPNGWNSTRRPLITLYRTEVELAGGVEELALHLEGNTAEAALYANGALLGVVNPHDPWIAVPPRSIAGGKVRLELLCRKREWSEPVGTASLFHLRRLPARVLGFGEEQVSGLRVADGKDLPLPLPLDRDRSYLVELDLDAVERRCSYAVFECRDVKLTAVFNGRVVGRIFGAANNRPSVAGGDGTRCYLPGPWYAAHGNRLVLFVEPISDHPELGAVAVQYAET